MASTDFIGSRLAAHAADHGDAVAFRFLGRRADDAVDLTWSQLWQAARERAVGLAPFRGRNVGILCAEPQEFVVALAAIFAAGAVAVPMPAVLSRRSAPRLQAILGTAELAAALASPSLLAAGWLSELQWPQGVRLISTADKASAIDPRATRPAGDPSAPLLVQYTSGSTSSPKGIVLSRANVAANCEAIARAYGLNRGSIGLSWLPLHHDMGLVGHVLTPLWVGGRSCIMDPLLFLQKPLRWLQSVSTQRATITSAPNFAYELCSRQPDDEAVDLDLSSLSTAVCGGEPVVPETLMRFVDRFGRFGLRSSALAPSYGLAEATLLVTSGRTPDGPSFLTPPEKSGLSIDGRRYTSLGRPVAGVRVRIVDAETRRGLSDGRVGELEVSGSSVGREIGTADSEWVGTGDLGFLSDGQLCVTGRSKDLLILRGQNVFPADIEAAVVNATTAVVPGGVAAVGLDRDGTQALAVIAELHIRRKDAGEIDGLREVVSRAIASSCGHVPGLILFVAPRSLPRTTSGKLRRRETAVQLAQGAFGSTTPPAASAGKSRVPPPQNERAPVATVDVTAPSFAHSAIGGFQDLRRLGPVTWQHTARSFLLTGYDDSAAALRSKCLVELDLAQSWRKIGATLNKDFGPSLRLLSFMPFLHEGDTHRKLRSVLARAVAPFANAEETFRRQVNRRLSAARRNGGFDLMAEFAGDLMFEIVCDVACIPEQERDGIRPLGRLAWALDQMISVRDREQITATLRACVTNLERLTARAVSEPGETLLHRLYDALPDDEPDRISSTAYMMAVILLMGNDATAGSIGFATRHLLAAGQGRVPQEHWESLSDDAIRFSSAVGYLTRVAIEDTEIAGCNLKQGEKIIVSPVAANHDPQTFQPDPWAILPERPLGPGLAFGGGAHVCVGARIARNVIRAAFEGLATLPPLTLRSMGTQTRGCNVRTLDSLPVDIGRH